MIEAHDGVCLSESCGVSRSLREQDNRETVYFDPSQSVTRPICPKREDKEDGVEVKIYTAQPGMLLGRRLANLYVIRDGLKRQFGEVKLQIIEVRDPDPEPT